MILGGQLGRDSAIPWGNAPNQGFAAWQGVGLKKANPTPSHRALVATVCKGVFIIVAFWLEGKDDGDPVVFKAKFFAVGRFGQGKGVPR